MRRRSMLRGRAHSFLMLVWLGTSAVGCARRGPPTAPSTQSAPATPLQLQLRLAVDQVSRLRGLRELRPVVAQYASDSEFVSLQAEGDALSRDEDTLAFYHVKRERIFVRRDVPVEASDAGELSLQDVLAHEVAHALQHQHFPSVYATRAETRDASLARLALIEGDASLVQVLCRAARRREAPEDAVEATAAQSPLVDPVVRDDDGKPVEDTEEAGAEASRVLDETFVYRAGARFVASLYRAGGFALVNRAFLSAPQTTADVLHPQRYLGGVGQRIIGSLVPPGSLSVPQAPLGELGLIGLLLACMPLDEARETARGWMGDRVLSAPGAESDRRPLIMVSAWEEERHVRRFSKTAAQCFTTDMASSVRSRLDGTVFALVANVEDPAPALDYAIRAAGKDPPRRPPFGKVALAPVPPRDGNLPDEAKGELVSEGRWRSTYLGLETQLPPNYSRGPAKGSVALRVQRPSGAGASVGLVAVVPWSRTTTHAGAIKNVIDKLAAQGVNARQTSRGIAPSPLGNAEWTAWHGDHKTGKNVELRLTTIPMCEGRTVLLTSVAWPTGDAKAQSELETWGTSFRRLPGDTPLCAALRARDSAGDAQKAGAEAAGGPARDGPNAR